MEAMARGRHMRISPRKMRLVVDLIRDRKVEDALLILQATRKKASPMVLKLLNSAVANALYTGDSEEETRINVDDLIVKKAFVDVGPVMKRFRPRSMGRANRIRKRTSHLTIVVGTKATAGAERAS